MNKDHRADEASDEGYRHIKARCGWLAQYSMWWQGANASDLTGIRNGSEYSLGRRCQNIMIIIIIIIVLGSMP
jgi:hypothetical protein